MSRMVMANGLELHAGDKLMIAMRDLDEDNDIPRIREQLAEHLPGVQVLLIDGVEGLAVHRGAQQQEG